MTDLPDRILEAIELRKQLDNEHHLGVCTIWTEGYRLKPGPCNCRGPAEVRRTCEADKRTVERHREHLGQCVGCTRLWPCPDLLDRADAWDIARETGDQT